MTKKMEQERLITPVSESMTVTWADLLGLMTSVAKKLDAIEASGKQDPKTLESYLSELEELQDHIETLQGEVEDRVGLLENETGESEDAEQPD